MYYIYSVIGQDEMWTENGKMLALNQRGIDKSLMLV